MHSSPYFSAYNAQIFTNKSTFSGLFNFPLTIFNTSSLMYAITSVLSLALEIMAFAQNNHSSDHMQNEVFSIHYK